MEDVVTPIAETQARDGDERARPPRAPKKAIAALAAGIGAVVVLLAVVLVPGDRDGDDDSTRTAASTPSPSVSSGPSSSPSTATTAPPSTTTSQPAQPSAADTLEPFFTSAAAMDEQLHAAAQAINGAGPPWQSVSEEIASLVRAADHMVVRRAVPAGLPPELLRAVITVYSDLDSRRAAMEGFANAILPGEPISGELLTELAGGHDAAERFDRDLADARTLAASLPPVAVIAPDSRAAAEVLLFLDYVDGWNWGCAGRGGYVVTELPEVVWQTGTSGILRLGDYQVGFEATVGPDGHWHTRILAC